MFRLRTRWILTSGYIGPIHDCCRRGTSCHQVSLQEIRLGAGPISSQDHHCNLCKCIPFATQVTVLKVHQGKRHHTRFYPTEEANADRNGNPRPGTVVDRGVTAIYNFDFFLQGTSHLHLCFPTKSNRTLQLTAASKARPARRTTTSSTTTSVSRRTSFRT